VKLRQAIDAAIDRTLINQVAFGGNFTPGNQTGAALLAYYASAFRSRRAISRKPRPW